jgi:hypothetical protein
VATYPSQDPSPVGGFDDGYDHATFAGPERRGDHARTHDAGEVGGNAKTTTGGIPCLPTWQDQPHPRQIQPSTVTDASNAFNMPNGADDGDWDDVADNR